jgi:phosphohistidine swiveling domain-containing protein
MSAPRVLVATLGIDYPAPARLPFELKQAGCDVAMFAPAGSLAAHTPYVDRRAIAAGRATTGAWTDLLLREIAAFDPAIVLPGDDAMVRMLVGLAIDPPSGTASTSLVDLLRASLGDLALVADSIDKTRLFEIARAAGLSVAEGGIASGVDDAVSIAESLGYPVIVRAGSGTGGAGTSRCENADAVAAAVRKVRVPDGWMPARQHRLLVQRWVDGPVIVRASLAWHGDEIAGITRGRLATYPHALGPGSAVVFAGIPSIAEALRTLLRALDATGFVGAQFIVEPGTGIPLLLEINRRMVPATYGSGYVGIDQARALAAMLRGERWSGPVDLQEGPGQRLALFPQEWYRDPESTWLADLPCDAPWHDPTLFRAMLRLPVDADPQALALRYDRAATARDAAALTSPSAARFRTASP